MICVFFRLFFKENRFQGCRKILIELNLFEGRSVRTSTVISHERILTRCFIVAIIIAMIIVSLYAFLQKQNQVRTIDKPSLETYYQLHNEHSNTLKCPCTNLFISYEKFLNMSVSLHQICSSDLISSIWLEYLSSFDLNLIPSWTKTSFSHDFRFIGASYFQILAAFCILANENAKNARQRFDDRQFISDYVHSPSQLLEETQLIINLFINMTNNDFAQEYDWIQFACSNNLFLSGTNINFDVTIDENDHIETSVALLLLLSAVEDDYISLSGVCGCGTGAFSAACYVVPFIYTNGSDIFEYDQIFWDIKISCLLTDGFTTKKTNWWYNDRYLQSIKNTYGVMLHYLPSSEITSLDPFVSSQYIEPTIRDLLRAMFIENWTVNNTQFDRYYHECSPLSCSYTIYERRPILVIVLLILAVCGGLNKGLRLLTILIGKIIFTIVNKQNNRHISRRIFHKIKNLNLFETAEQDESIKREQKIDTKVYLILFMCCLSIILFYTMINERSIIETHLLNSVDEYNLFYDQYENDLNCPCTRISIPYDNFITELYVDRFFQQCEYNSMESILFDCK